MAADIIILGTHTESAKEKFRKAAGGKEILFADFHRNVPEEDLASASVAIGDIEKDCVMRMPNLRFVQLFSAGANGFSYLPEQVILANAYGAYGENIAEHMLATTLLAFRRMPEYFEIQKKQAWELLYDIKSIAGAKVLSVGMGAIGTAYLEKMHALGAVAYGVRRTVHDKPDFVEALVTPDEMDELLPEMDVVALSLPGTAEVEGMFDERRLRLMKKTAIILNTGRGNSIVTADLVRVLQDGHLKAACLDVMDPEPLPKDHPLWTTPRVYITPHISGGYRAGVNYGRVMDTAVRNLTLVSQGKPPIHSVDRTLGY